MQIKYSDKAENQKNDIIKEYINFEIAFERLESVILSNPSIILSKNKMPCGTDLLYRSVSISLMSNVSLKKKLYLYFFKESDEYINICLALYE